MFVLFLIKLLHASHPHLDSRMSLDEFESAAFGKPFPDRKTEWYPYESKTVRRVVLILHDSPLSPSVIDIVL